MQALHLFPCDAVNNRLMDIDVYKRQVVNYMEDYMRRRDPDCMRAVSYTHLDVYKSQFWACARWCSPPAES